MKRSSCCVLFAGALFLTTLLGGCHYAGAEPAAALPDFVGLVKDNAASVVNISTTQKVEVGATGGQGMGNILRQLFGDEMGHQLERRWGQQQPSQPHAENLQSLGSGFILSKDGYILTNYHIVKDADSIIVRLNDRRELPAKLIGKDAQSDLALLKIDANDLKPVTIGSSRDLQAGQWVLAIGFDSSATAGIVSVRSRSLPDSIYVPFIQTDLPINSGDSGGPLFNLKGEVVGINSQIASRSGVYMGLSFAIPIDLAMQVVDQLKAGKPVAHGWLGMMIQDVTPDLAQSFGLDRPVGVLVSRVTQNSPADKAGIKAGDVIVAFNGASVDAQSDLLPMVGFLAPGEQVKLEIVRQSKHQTLTVTVGASSDATHGSLGLVVGDLSPADRAQAGVSQGVKVTRVLPGSAANAGIGPGDIIESLNNEPVTDTATFSKLLTKYRNSASLALLVNRQGNTGFVVVHQGGAE